VTQSFALNFLRLFMVGLRLKVNRPVGFGFAAGAEAVAVPRRRQAF